MGRDQLQPAGGGGGGGDTNDAAGTPSAFPKTCAGPAGVESRNQLVVYER